MPPSLARMRFERRHLFTGRLVLVTALHIGGGRATLAPTDSAVVRGPDLKPFIPGSSFKGSFRSTVEKLAPAVELPSCGLTDDGRCPGAPGETQKRFNKAKEDGTWDEVRVLEELDGKTAWRLCATCRLFGSPQLASKVFFDDLLLLDWAGTTQVRDGVGIDRDSERAVDGLKYDFEVVPPGSVFDFRMTLEEASDIDLGLACAGLREFVSGLAGVGGKRSRGLGRCRLEALAVYELDLHDQATRGERLKNYLLKKELHEKMRRLPDPDAFLEGSITKLVNLLGEPSNAQAPGQ